MSEEMKENKRAVCSNGFYGRINGGIISTDDRKVLLFSPHGHLTGFVQMGWSLLKEQFAQKYKFSHLLTLVLVMSSFHLLKNTEKNTENTENCNPTVIYDPLVVQDFREGPPAVIVHIKTLF